MPHDFGGKCGRRDRDAPYISSTSRFVLGERHRFNALRAALEIIGVPQQLWKEIVESLESSGWASSI